MRINLKKKGKTMKLYKIKELEWRGEVRGIYHFFVAESIVKKYIIRVGRLDFTVTLDGTQWSGSLNACKNQCQQHYEQRLLVSLEEVDVLERVKEKCHIAVDLPFVPEHDRTYNFAQQLLQLIDKLQKESLLERILRNHGVIEIGGDCAVHFFDDGESENFYLTYLGTTEKNFDSFADVVLFLEKEFQVD